MKKVVRLTESELIRLVKRVIKEQSSRPKYEVNQVYEAIRSIDNKKYTIKVKTVGDGWIMAEIDGPGTYKNAPFGVYGWEYELNTITPGELSGNMEMGDFTQLKRIK